MTLNPVYSFGRIYVCCLGIGHFVFDTWTEPKHDMDAKGSSTHIDMAANALQTIGKFKNCLNKII